MMLCLLSKRARCFGSRLTERVVVVTELQNVLPWYRVTEHVEMFTELQNALSWLQSNRTRCYISSVI